METNNNQPNFFVVGCVKGGTTSLHNYLLQHPEIYLTPIKETNYFSRKDMDPKHFRKDYAYDVALDLEKYFKNQPLKPVHIAQVTESKHYLKLYAGVKDEKVKGEICNSYLICESAAAEIKREFPNAKIAMILRNPIDRAFSQYLMNLKEAKAINRSFLEEIEKDQKSELKGWGISHQYLELGLYYEQVKRYFDLFPKEQIKIILYEEYKNSIESVLQELCDFLGVDNHFSFDTDLKLNEKGLPRFKYLNYALTQLGIIKLFKNLLSKPIRQKLARMIYSSDKLKEIQAEEREFLIDYYKEDITNLSNLIDRDLKSWLS